MCFVLNCVHHIYRHYLYLYVLSSKNLDVMCDFKGISTYKMSTIIYHLKAAVTNWWEPKRAEYMLHMMHSHYMKQKKSICQMRMVNCETVDDRTRRIVYYSHIMFVAISFWYIIYTYIYVCILSINQTGRFIYIYISNM